MMMIQCSHTYPGALEINILKLMMDRTKLNLEIKKMKLLEEMLTRKAIPKPKQILKQKMRLKQMTMPYHESEEELMLIRSSKTLVNQVIPLLALVLVWLTSAEAFLLFPC